MNIKKILLSLASAGLAFAAPAYGQYKPITIEGIWKEYLFTPKNVPGYQTLASDDFYTVTTDSSIDKHRFDNGQKTASLITQTQLEAAGAGFQIRDIDGYALDEKETKILLATQEEAIYRRSAKAYYYVFDRQTQRLVPLSDSSKGKQSFAAFSPDGLKAAFVRNNNLFFVDLTTGAEIQITHDGASGKVLNGIADWVYEEELGMSCCFYWSPDNTQLAYLRFDESEVKQYTLAYYDSLYPSLFTYKYPKAGEDNSAVSLHVYNLKGSMRKTLLWTGKDHYIPRLYWLHRGEGLLALLMNRDQNRIEFYRYDALSGQKELVYVDTNSRWVEVSDDYFICPDNRSMITTSERDGFNHIYHVTFGGAVARLTAGEWEVSDIAAADMQKKVIYYHSNESGVLNRDLYRIDFDGKNKKRLSTETGWNVAVMSPTCKFYRNVYSDANTPPVYTIHRCDGTPVKRLQDNAAYGERMREYGFGRKVFFQFTPPDGVLLDGWMIFPKDFDTTQKYPLLMYVYGGPGSQSVRNAFGGAADFAWYQLLAQKGYIIACVDGRGCAGKGDAFRKVIHKQMGRLEAEDQISAARYFQTLPFVDGQRIGIWGWSFGGYLSSLAMFTGDGVFKAAIAVAPVASWRYYDNIYTERFLSTPQQNPAGYDSNSPVMHAHKMTGKYLLIHGMADDNVHFQNAAALITALNRADKQYEQFFYPNKNHSIYGGNTRYHLYVRMTDFILRNL
jgi:dipeptidyl-peptidase-4